MTDTDTEAKRAWIQEAAKLNADRARLKAENEGFCLANADLATALVDLKAFNTELLVALKRMTGRFENCARHAGNDPDVIEGATQSAHDIIAKAK